MDGSALLMRQARVLVVDDGTLMRKLLCAAIEAEPSLAVAGTAVNGRIALSMLSQSIPDLIVFDMEMSELDGLATLVEIKKLYPRLPVIMFSSRGTEATITALMHGASDYVTKPSGLEGVAEVVAAISDMLVPRILALCARKLNPDEFFPSDAEVRLRVPLAEPRPIEIVAIGSSTGGADALAAVLSQIPEDFCVPVVIAQHMPPVFTNFLAQRLNAISPLNVAEGQDGQPLAAGSASIAPGGFHMVVKRGDASIVLATNQEPEENSCRPSVDVLFRSVAEIYGDRALAVVLTGMGQDGFVGSRELVRNGSRVFVQDMPTSAVWGMPGIIARSNLVEQVLPLEAIGQQLVAAVTVSRRASGRIGAGKKVLIVDDAVVMRMMIKNILTKNGFEVVGEAENGSLAVQKYRALQPDIVTMDMVMPYMDGISAVKAIVAEFPNAKIIMCTSMGQQELVVQAIQAGAKSFITKPFQPTKIVEAVEKVLA